MPALPQVGQDLGQLVDDDVVGGQRRCRLRREVGELGFGVSGVLVMCGA